MRTVLPRCRLQFPLSVLIETAPSTTERMWKRLSFGKEWGRAKPQAVENEFVALDEVFDIVIACCGGRDWVHWAAGVVGYIERLLDVKLARFAVAVDAVPIEQPIGGVAGLLDFGDQEAGAECVDGAGFDQNAIAHAWLELMEADFAVAAGQLALERLPVDAGFQAGVNLASWFGGQDDPGFGFSQVGRIEFCALLVVRVDLHRQRFLAVEKFQKQRKLIARIMAAEDCAAFLRHELVQCFARERSIGDRALIGAVVDDLPAFGVVLAGADRFAEVGSEPAAAPQIFSQDRIESKWRKLRACEDSGGLGD